MKRNSLEWWGGTIKCLGKKWYPLEAGKTLSFLFLKIYEKSQKTMHIKNGRKEVIVAVNRHRADRMRHLLFLQLILLHFDQRLRFFFSRIFFRRFLLFLDSSLEYYHFLLGQTWFSLCPHSILRNLFVEISSCCCISLEDDLGGWPLDAKNFGSTSNSILFHGDKVN